MGKRREPRKELRLPVRLFGTDADGRVFSENVFTANVSRQGAKLVGVQNRVKVGEVVGISYKQAKDRFRVSWVGQAGTPQQGEVGVVNLALGKYIWDVPLPAPVIDNYRQRASQTGGGERRKHSRAKSNNSLELHPEGQAAPIWGKASDLGMGGCFVEMPIPLKLGTTLKVGLWLNQEKLWLNAKVVNSRPGFGIGLQFTQVSPEDAERLQRFLKSISRSRL